MPSVAHPYSGGSSLVRFVTDNTVGKLRRWMGLLGYDVEYTPRGTRELIADTAFFAPDVIIVGRCPTLACDPALEGRFFHVESPDLIEQLRQITRAFPMDFAATLFSRCQHCNTVLGDPVSLERIEDRLPPLVKEWGSDFHECPSCHRLYWEGTHTRKIRTVLLDRVGLDLPLGEHA